MLDMEHMWLNGELRHANRTVLVNLDLAQWRYGREGKRANPTHELGNMQHAVFSLR